jgi:hypothetical protein
MRRTFSTANDIFYFFQMKSAKIGRARIVNTLARQIFVRDEAK